MSAANVCVFVAEDRFQNRRDPMSHRIIEKRRRDRMNNCLADLSKLIPVIYLKKGRGRIEKTEIIEMAIKHLKHLQAHACKEPATCEVAQRIDTDHRNQYKLGFHECMSECVRFLVEVEGPYLADDICVRLMGHLQKHFDKVQGHGFCYQMPPVNSSGAVDVLSTEIVRTNPPPTPQPLANQSVATIPIQVHPSPASVMMPMMGKNPSNSCSPSTQVEDVKPMDIDSNPESAFTRRAGSSFAPRGGLLQNSHEIHHLLEVPKQEGPSRPGSKERKIDSESLPIDSKSHLNDSSLQNSQLREILQTPLSSLTSSIVCSSLEPNMRKRSNTDTNLSFVSGSSCEGGLTSKTTQHSNASPSEEVYHFKKNIKDRFQSHSRLYTTSPTNSVEDPENPTGHEERRYSHSQVQGPVASPHSPASFSRHTVSAPPISETEAEPASAVKSLSASRGHHRGTIVKWEPNQLESSNSSGSPPRSSLAPSSASSSGYSSNGSADATNGPHLRRMAPLSSPTVPSRIHLAGAAAGVPIFALHPAGSFYIPLTMDKAVLNPFIREIDEAAAEEPVLYPVSISVNVSFCSKHVSTTTVPPWAVGTKAEATPLLLPNGRA